MPLSGTPVGSDTPNFDPSIIAAMGAMQGTLTPEGILSSLRAQQDAEVARVSQQAEEAAKASQAAQGAFQQASQAPAPQLGGSTFAQTLLGNTASALTGNQGFAERAGQNVARTQAELLESRRQNLQALHDTYEQKAQMAEHTGDIATAEKARVQQERVAQTLLQIKSQQDLANDQTKAAIEQGYQLARIHATGEEARKTQALKDADKSDQTDELNSTFENLTRTTGGGNQVLDVSQVPAKFKMAALKYAADNKMLALGQPGIAKLDDVDTARNNIKLMLQHVDSVLPKNAAEARWRGPANAISGALAIDPEVRAFGTFRTAAIQQLKALAGGVGSGLRINQAEIQQALQNDIPVVGGLTPDTADSARQKLQNILDLLDNTERPFVKRDLREQATPQSAPTGGVARFRVKGPDGAGLWRADKPLPAGYVRI